MMHEDISFEEAYQKCEEVLNNHKAYNAFEKWIKNQNGDMLVRKECFFSNDD